MEFIEQVLERKGCRLHYWLGGPTGAPLVVFTHGATIDHREWDATLPLVARHFSVLTWDLRGHGLSRPGLFKVADALDDLLAILDHQGIQQAAFVGHSLGGNLHQELVFRHPERVRVLVCVDCTWNFQKLSPLESFTVKMAEPIFKVYPYRLLVDQSLALTAKSKDAQDLLRAAMIRLSKDEIVQIMMAATLCLHYEPGYATNKPLLLILGENDRTGNIRKAMPLWAKVEPDCRLVVIPNTLHAPNLDDPDTFHRLLIDFLVEKLA